MNLRLRTIVSTIVAMVVATNAAWGQDSTAQRTQETTTIQVGDVKYDHTTSDDGEEGKSLEIGGITISENNDGKGKETTGIEVKGGEAGGQATAETSTGGDHWDAGAQANATAKADWSVGADDDGNTGIQGGAKVGVDGSVTVGVNGQIGDDQNNIHGSGEITLSAEVVAEIKGQLTVNDDGTVVAKADARIGASVSADATIKGGVTIWGVPIDVVLTGGVSAGAEAGASAGVTFDAKTGKLKVTLEASAVLGVGAHGNVTVEIGIVQLAEAIGTGIGNVIGGIGNKIEGIGDTLGDLWNWINGKLSDKDDDPFDGDPEGNDKNPGKNGRYQGLKPLKLID